MPDTIRLSLAAPDDVREPLVAALADLGFDAFEDTPDDLVAYAPAPRWDGPTTEAVHGLADAYGLAAGAVVVETIADQDWNATWEASLEPVTAGPFVVAPTWTDVPDSDAVVLRIDPKMAFGTGYHETTRICLRLLADAVTPDDTVLDVGTGTGVLAIAALRLGAASAVGVDVDPWSVTNGRENADRNGVGDRFEVREGSVEVVTEAGFDLVVCNVIRSIMEPMRADLLRLSAGGTLVLSGLLATERDRVVAQLSEAGRKLRDEAAENEWWGGVFEESAA
ncbi:50S ribosomal protein L11 methyltransferase [Rubrivirga sp. IMCC43871]|uniref:50S ribosomal protein L11 methyltransferase n=1 Tax=Rubrivirga sp. IMCC43871 TaxID=3391575 RepID=UPI00398FB4E0